MNDLSQFASLKAAAMMSSAESAVSARTVDNADSLESLPIAAGTVLATKDKTTTDQCDNNEQRSTGPQLQNDDDNQSKQEDGIAAKSAMSSKAPGANSARIQPPAANNAISKGQSAGYPNQPGTATATTIPTTTTELQLAPASAQPVLAASLSSMSLQNSHLASKSSSIAIRSIGSLVCRICHTAENPENLVSPCLCKGSLTYVHINCLEHWICTSGKTICELCLFRYKTVQTLRYTCMQSLRMWYSRSASRRALQEDCQIFSLLTLVVFGIVGTILVAVQYHILHEQNMINSGIWKKGWTVGFLFVTLIVYCANVYMIVRSQLSPWFQWWQSARDIKLILENRKPIYSFRKVLHRNHLVFQDEQQHPPTGTTSTDPNKSLPSAAPAAVEFPHVTVIHTQPTTTTSINILAQNQNYNNPHQSTSAPEVKTYNKDDN